ncbi:MAG: 50S ribosomal protein L20 [Fimbriimonadaceae bacterium]|nr:50S ribosomal protein L20 [Armatimonadota bacterium]
MARVKRGIMRQKRHRKVLKKASGYYGRKSRTFKNAHEQVMKSGAYAFRDRRAKKRDFRRLWIARISAACREHGVKYGDFIHALTEKGIEVNRKMLSELAINDPSAFKNLLETVTK